MHPFAPRILVSASRHSTTGLLAFVLTTAAVLHAEPPKSEWARPGADGKLVYKTTPAGDRMLDFSHAGYGGGGVALPDVPARVTVRPSGGDDDSARVQAAIDQVSALPLQNGFRGAVLLAPGTFFCANTLTISTDGVVLRGSGSTGEKRSTLKLTGKPHLAVAVRHASTGRRGASNTETPADFPRATRTTIADAYVPSGANAFTVVDATGFAAGDTISIQRPVTEAWVKLMGMHDLTRDNKPQTWMRVGSVIPTERRVAALNGNRITLDVPLSDSFDATYLNPPGTTVVKINPPIRVKQAGVESLHIESPLQEIGHSQAHFTALRINGEDCWARDLVVDETMNSVGVGGRRITLQRVAVHRKAKHQGASKPAEFAPNASEVLLDRCSVVGDNVWFIATGGLQAGPIVILNCTFLGNGRAEAHQRWSTGMLYDNCRAPQGGFEIRNRGSMGSGHGWAMGWGVVWNCVAKDYIVQNPPGAVNWLIGSVGHRKSSPRPFGSGADLPGATDDSPGVPVAPQSLYLAQLNDRLGAQALKNIGYSSANLDSPESKAIDDAPSSTTGRVTPLNPTLGENLAVDRPVLTSNVRAGDRQFAGWQALDHDPQTYWATDDAKLPATLELDTEGALEINAVELAEAANQTGHVQSYQVEGFINGAWQTLVEGGSIGGGKIERFPTATVWKVRLTILKAKPSATISTFGLYREKR
jgi:hypothetical protein